MLLTMLIIAFAALNSFFILIFIFAYYIFRKDEKIKGKAPKYHVTSEGILDEINHY